MKKPRAQRDNFGLLIRASANYPEAQNITISYLYYVFRVFARPETPVFCSYVKFVVVGVAVFSASAGVVGGDRPTAVMNAVLPEDAVPTERLKDDTVKLSEDDVHIVRPNVVGEND
jgi:hypothetical protein